MSVEQQVAPPVPMMDDDGNAGEPVLDNANENENENSVETSASDKSDEELLAGLGDDGEEEKMTEQMQRKFNEFLQEHPDLKKEDFLLFHRARVYLHAMPGELLGRVKLLSVRDAIPPAYIDKELGLPPGSTDKLLLRQKYENWPLHLRQLCLFAYQTDEMFAKHVRQRMRSVQAVTSRRIADALHVPHEVLVKWLRCELGLAERSLLDRHILSKFPNMTRSRPVPGSVQGDTDDNRSRISKVAEAVTGAKRSRDSADNSNDDTTTAESGAPPEPLPLVSREDAEAIVGTTGRGAIRPSFKRMRLSDSQIARMEIQQEIDKQRQVLGELGTFEWHADPVSTVLTV
ncbi:MAG: hypothetical protein MHM6MM_001952 [Cercozoa sp. M6MM]